MIFELHTDLGQIIYMITSPTISQFDVLAMICKYNDLNYDITHIWDYSQIDDMEDLLSSVL